MLAWAVAVAVLLRPMDLPFTLINMFFPCQTSQLVYEKVNHYNIKSIQIPAGANLEGPIYHFDSKYMI